MLEVVQAILYHTCWTYIFIHVYTRGETTSGAKRLGGRNDQGGNDQGGNVLGAKRLGGGGGGEWFGGETSRIPPRLGVRIRTSSHCLKKIAKTSHYFC